MDQQYPAATSMKWHKNTDPHKQLRVLCKYDLCKNFL